MSVAFSFPIATGGFAMLADPLPARLAGKCVCRTCGHAAIHLVPCDAPLDALECSRCRLMTARLVDVRSDGVGQA